MDLSTRIRIGRWTATPALNLLASAERSVKIEPRTMDVLAYLAARPGEVVSVDELLSNVWRGVVVGDGSVYLAIKQLRQALTLPADETVYIETIPKRGYRLTAPVERLASESGSGRGAAEIVLPPRNGEATAAPSNGYAAERVSPQAVTATTAPLREGRQAAPRWRLAAVFALGLGVAGASVVGGTLLLRDDRPAPQPPRLHLEFRAPQDAGGFSVSPDGRHVVYMAPRNGVPRLWVRRLDTGFVEPLAGAEMALAPFWSADGNHVAYVSDTKLKRIPITGGVPQELADTPRLRPSATGTWSTRDTILFGSEQYDIGRVSADGGAVEQATVPPNEVCKQQPPMPVPKHLAPRILPDGERFLYLELGCGEAGLPYSVHMGSLGTAEHIRVAALTRQPRETPHVVIQNIEYANGFLLWLLDGTLMAQRLDLDTARLTGEAVAVAEEVGDFSVSKNGVLVYREWVPMTMRSQESSAPTRRLVRYDRNGQIAGEVRAPPRYRLQRVSPDGRHIAVTAPMLRGERGETDDIWTMDVEQSTAFPLTTDDAGDTSPVWSRDGAYLAFNSGRDAIINRPSRIYRRAANGTGADELLFAGEIDEFTVPLDWSSDGRYIVFARGRYATARTKSDLWVLPLAEGESAFALLESPDRKRAARLSPDGRWIAFSTDESGRDEIVVQPFPNVGDGLWQVSIAGGHEPRWRNDGRELFYLAPDGKVMAVDIETTGTAFARGEPRALFATGLTITGAESPPDSFYDVTADGQQFFVAEPIASNSAAPEHEPEQTVHVIVNWHAPLPAAPAD